MRKLTYNLWLLLPAVSTLGGFCGDLQVSSQTWMASIPVSRIRSTQVTDSSRIHFSNACFDQRVNQVPTILLLYKSNERTCHAVGKRSGSFWLPRTERYPCLSNNFEPLNLEMVLVVRWAMACWWWTSSVTSMRDWLFWCSTAVHWCVYVSMCAWESLCVFVCVQVHVNVGPVNTSAVILRNTIHLLWDKGFHFSGAHQLC